jgi:hypothetical protein
MVFVARRLTNQMFPVGLEPTTFGSGGRRSIQLSYGNELKTALLGRPSGRKTNRKTNRKTKRTWPKSASPDMT